DQLLRIFAGDRVRAIMDRLKMPEGEPIEAGIVTRSIESAQRKVEGRNFDIRKQLLQYDDVANDQRREIYKLRNEILEAVDAGDLVKNLRESVFVELFRAYVPAESMEEQWDLAGLEKTLRDDWGVEVPLVKTVEQAQSIEDEELLTQVQEAVEAVYAGKVAQVGRESFAGFERSVMLQSLDTHWREHLAALDHLRQGIHLRGYAQKDPKQEYKRESFELFGRLLDNIRNEVTRIIFTVRIQSQAELEEASEQIEEDLSQLTNVQYKHDEFSELAEVAAGDAEIHGETPPVPAHRSAAASAAAALAGQVPKVGRNDPCPCGSGKKYKQCHGKLA
ncbi:SEC-C metal-binding domain-containing protein, partial [Ralstonia pseudosolanacearum]